MRLGRVGTGAAEAKRLNPSDAKNGSPMHAVVLRKNRRRGKLLFMVFRETLRGAS
jgi:hypothetical protein